MCIVKCPSSLFYRCAILLDEHEDQEFQLQGYSCEQFYKALTTFTAFHNTIVAPEAPAIAASCVYCLSICPACLASGWIGSCSVVIKEVDVSQCSATRTRLFRVAAGLGVAAAHPAKRELKPLPATRNLAIIDISSCRATNLLATFVAASASSWN